MEDEFLDAVVSADEEFPSVTGRVATLRRIFHDHPAGGTLPQREFMFARLCHFCAAVQRKMQGKEQPILIVEESRINFVLHDSGFVAELRAQVRQLYGFARLVLPLVGAWAPRPNFEKL